MDDADSASASERDLEGDPHGARPQLRVLRGGGQPKPLHLGSRNDLASVLVGAAADLLLRRISAPRAHEIEQRVERLMDLFDRVEREPLLDRVLRRELDGLEALIREGGKRASKVR